MRPTQDQEDGDIDEGDDQSWDQGRDETGYGSVLVGVGGSRVCSPEEAVHDGRFLCEKLARMGKLMKAQLMVSLLFRVIVCDARVACVVMLQEGKREASILFSKAT
jgi:hypothetical protein